MVSYERRGTMNFDLDTMDETIKEELIAFVANMLGPDASDEEIQAAVADLMKEMQQSLHTPVQCTLEECLVPLTREELMDLLKTNHYSGYSKLKKADLIAAAIQTLTHPDYMPKMFASLTKAEVNLMDDLCETSIPLISTDILYCATELLRYGLCYIDPMGKHLVLPEELKLAFRAAQQNEVLQKKMEKNTLTYTVCNAAVYLYGVYPIASLLVRLKQSGLRFTEQELLTWHTTSAITREEYFFKNGSIISTALQQTPEDVVALQQIQKTRKQFYWPRPEELMELTMEQWLINANLYEPFWDLAPFLMENEFGDTLSVSRFVEASIRTGAPFDALIGFLSEQIFAFESEEDIDTFIDVMQKIWDNTPMWENCGFTPKATAAGWQKKTTEKNTQKTGKVVSLADHKAKKK